MSHTLSLTFSCVSPCGVRGEGWRRLRACSSERLVWTGRLGGEGEGGRGEGLVSMDRKHGRVEVTRFKTAKALSSVKTTAQSNTVLGKNLDS